jgi:hypothetical protein
MSRFIRRTATRTVGSLLALGLAALTTTATVGIPAADAAVSGPPAAQIVPTSCVSHAVWLQLTTTTGPHCYSGNGAKVVNLTVSTARIVGVHTVCFFSIAPTRLLCVKGPTTRAFVPPAHVRAVTVKTP